MKIVQNSAVVCFFATRLCFFSKAWKESVLRKVFALIGLAMIRSISDSWLCQFAWREGTLTLSLTNSVACRFFAIIVNSPISLAQWIYKRWSSVFHCSITFRLASIMCGSIFLFVGFFMLIVLIIPHGSWNNLYALYLIILMLLIFCVEAMPQPKHRLEITTLGPYFTLFMAFVLYSFFTSLGTDFTNGIAQGLRNSLSFRFLTFYIIAFLITLMVVSTIKSTKHLQLMLSIALAGLVIASFYGCYQGWQGVEVVPSQQDALLNPGMPGRVYSFFDNPNVFGQILVMLMPFHLALFINVKTWICKILVLISTTICLVAIALTFFRTGWIGLAIAVIIFLAMMNWRFLPIFLLTGLIALPFLPESIINRILTIGNLRDSSFQYRLNIYKETIYLIRDYGFRGVGLGTDVMTKVFQHYPTMFDGNYPIHTHNHYLQLWVELGFFGVIAFMAMVIQNVKIAIKCFYSSTNREAKSILAAGVGALCAISAIGMMEYIWFYPRVMFVYFFLLGVIVAAAKLAKKKNQ